ncbi:MAG: hypothetical protein AB7N76_33325 [Planctomycetota bacterium]
MDAFLERCRRPGVPSDPSPPEERQPAWQRGLRSWIEDLVRRWPESSHRLLETFLQVGDAFVEAPRLRQILSRYARPLRSAALPPSAAELERLKKETAAVYRAHNSYLVSASLHTEFAFAELSACLTFTSCAPRMPEDLDALARGLGLTALKLQLVLCEEVRWKDDFPLGCPRLADGAAADLLHWARPDDHPYPTEWTTWIGEWKRRRFFVPERARPVSRPRRGEPPPPVPRRPGPLAWQELASSPQWSRLVGFVGRWFSRPLRPSDGVREDELAWAEARLGIRLPAAVAEFYRIAGNRLGPFLGRNRLCALDQLEYDDRGGLLLGAAHQGCAYYMVLPGALSRADPRVDMDTGHRLGRASDFYLAFLIEETAEGYAQASGWRTGVRSGRHSCLGNDTERIEDYYAKLPVSPLSEAIYADRDTVLVADAAGEVVAAARTPRAWGLLEERFGDQGMWTRNGG